LGYYNFINSVTVTAECIESYKNAEIHVHTTVSSAEGDGLPNLWVAYYSSGLSSTLLSMSWVQC
jgi:hypothetical protein